MTKNDQGRVVIYYKMWADEKYWKSGVNCDGLVTLDNQNCSDKHNMPELYVFKSTKKGKDSLPKGKPKLLPYEAEKMVGAKDLETNLQSVSVPFTKPEAEWWKKLIDNFRKVIIYFNGIF